MTSATGLDWTASRECVGTECSHLLLNCGDATKDEGSFSCTRRPNCGDPTRRRVVIRGTSLLPLCAEMWSKICTSGSPKALNCCLPAWIHAIRNGGPPKALYCCYLPAWDGARDSYPNCFTSWAARTVGKDALLLVEMGCHRWPLLLVNWVGWDAPANY